MNELIEKLKYAKDAVKYLVDHKSASVDFHSLTYWAPEVERLWTEIENML